MALPNILHAMAQVKRVLHYQLPPRGFWFWLCDGLKVYDALVVAAWLAINVLWVEQRTSLVQGYYEHPKTYEGEGYVCFIICNGIEHGHHCFK